MLAVIKHVVDDNIICMHQLMVRATTFNNCCAKLSILPLSYGPNRPELNAVDYQI